MKWYRVDSLFILSLPLSLSHQHCVDRNKENKVNETTIKNSWMKELAHLGLTYYSMLRTKRDFQTQLIFNKNHTFSKKNNNVSEDRCNFHWFSLRVYIFGVRCEKLCQKRLLVSENRKWFATSEALSSGLLFSDTHFKYGNCLLADRIQHNLITLRLIALKYSG